MAQNMSSLALTSLPHWTAFSQSASLYLVGGMVMYSCHLVTSGILVRPGPWAGWAEMFGVPKAEIEMFYA